MDKGIARIKGYKKAYMRVLRQPNELCLAYYKGRLISLVVFSYVANGRFSPVSDIGLIRLEDFKKLSLIIHKKPNKYIEILNG